MKYIREYKEEWYYKINKEEFVDLFDRLLTISESEVTIINNYLKPFGCQITFPPNVNDIKNKPHLGAVLRYGKTQNYERNIIHARIYKIDDEWYLTEMQGNFYKCDQMEGLLKNLQMFIE